MCSRPPKVKSNPWVGDDEYDWMCNACYQAKRMAARRIPSKALGEWEGKKETPKGDKCRRCRMPAKKVKRWYWLQDTHGGVKFATTT